MARLTKKDWLEEGFKILTEFAQDKLKIMYLCERLGVTRGSFYHHFTSIENYVSELMEEWEDQNTMEFIRVASQGQSPEDKIELLNNQVKRTNHALETSIRSWSFYKPIVKKHLEKVDRIRLSYLENIFEESGMPSEQAKLKAKLEYILLVGLQQLFPDMPEDEMVAIYEFYQT